MKAEIITQMICNGVFAWIHGESSPIRRILIPEANNLVITLHENGLYIWYNFQRTDDCETIKEIEIPDELIEKAVNFMKDKNFLFKQFQKFIEK